MAKGQPAYKPASPEERRVRLVPIDERRRRTEFIEGLMVAGLSMPQVERAARESFAMNRVQVASYVGRIRERWAEEEKAQRPHNKAQQMRRVCGHIAEARRDKNWAAVAQFEKLLSDIQGTKEPVEINVNVDAVVTEAALQVIAGLTPERRRALIDEQRRLRALAAKAEVIDVEGKPVELGARATTQRVVARHEHRRRALIRLRAPKARLSVRG